LNTYFLIRSPETNLTSIGQKTMCVRFFLRRITRGDRKKKIYTTKSTSVVQKNKNKGLAAKRWGGKGIHFFGYHKFAISPIVDGGYMKLYYYYYYYYYTEGMRVGRTHNIRVAAAVAVLRMRRVGVCASGWTAYTNQFADGAGMKWRQRGGVRIPARRRRAKRTHTWASISPANDRRRRRTRGATAAAVSKATTSVVMGKCVCAVQRGESGYGVSKSNLLPLARRLIYVYSGEGRKMVFKGIIYETIRRWSKKLLLMN